MTLRRVLAASFFALSGIAFFCSFSSLRVGVIGLFLEAEPFFSFPIQPSHQAVAVRRDKNGKGYFGASRNGGRTHQGIDLLSAIGDPILASKSGRVTQAGWQKGYGGVVKIAHPDGSLTVYAHLSRARVRKGQWVSRGASVGYTGKSGNASEPATLPHLHFEIRRKDVSIDPRMGPLDPNVRLISS